MYKIYKKNPTKYERERERENLFCVRKKICIKWEKQIYSKIMSIRRDKIKEDKWTKLNVKLKPSKRNMYRQYLVITLKLK